MPIQWFPGHMVAARKKSAEVMERTDVVIEVLDARLPMASSNPMIDELRRYRQRPCLKLLNKGDLADPAVLRAVADEGYQDPTPIQAKAIPASNA